MIHHRFDFLIQTAGALLWLAPRSFGGLTPEDLGKVWMGGGKESVEDLIGRGVIMPLGLYQDDGYSVRYVCGELTQQESCEWTARASMNLDIPCGELLISGVLTPSFHEMEFPEIRAAEANSSTEYGCYINVTPGIYRADVYAYPPGDLAGGWGHIVDSRSFGKIPGIEPEKASKYFERTRSGEVPPAWINNEQHDTYYLDFLVHLSPKDSTLPPPRIDVEQAGVGLAWEFRKPEICPVGIPLAFERE